MLHRIGALASSMLRGSDVAGRMGGDEFAVLLLESDTHAGARFLRRLHLGVAELVGARSSRRVQPERGLRALSVAGPEADALLRLADARQYETKRAKRG